MRSIVPFQWCLEETSSRSHFVHRTWHGFNLHTQNLIWNFKESSLLNTTALAACETELRTVILKISKIIHLADFFCTVFDSLYLYILSDLRLANSLLVFWENKLVVNFLFMTQKISVTCDAGFKKKKNYRNFWFMFFIY